MGLSTHILDTSKGRPAAGVPVSLAMWLDDDWVMIHEATTDIDGRVKHLLPEEQSLQAGHYRVRFNINHYAAQQGMPSFYPYIDVVIVIELDRTQEHYHVPLLVTANGYTTYRGS
jgi:5-hydroxyisourate hydrolase